MNKNIQAIVILGLVSIILRLLKMWPIIYLIALPLTTLAIFFLALNLKKDSKYANWILIGLFCSMCGDATLQLGFISKFFFYLGMFFFFMAHIFYTFSFWQVFQIRKSEIFSLIFFLVFGIVIFLFLKEGLGEFYYPVMLYTCVICLMGWRAFSARFLPHFQRRQKSLIPIGSLLFIVSDSVLAYSLFINPLPYESVWVLVTYFTAQTLFALSTEGR